MKKLFTVKFSMISGDSISIIRSRGLIIKRKEETQ